MQGIGPFRPLAPHGLSLALVLVLAGRSVVADEPPPSVEKLFERVRPAVVVIEQFVDDERQERHARQRELIGRAEYL